MANPALQQPRFFAPGAKLGRYELVRQLAVGGMAELYLARTTGMEGFEKLVCVKRILPQLAGNQSFVTMFLKEARLAATLHHPNIAQVFDIGQDQSDYFFSMEYVHGEDLGRLMASAQDAGVPIGMDAALTFVAGLCAGLHYAHEKIGPDGKPLAVVHRDVSPSNVLISYEGAVKLVDFGIARAGSTPTTAQGGLKGKIAYMSPEQCMGQVALDRRSDIFSVGSILYELTTGRAPFLAETEFGVLNQIVTMDVPPPSRFVPGYPLALEAIVMRALARDPDQRYRTALELQGHLEDFAHENRLRISPLVLGRLMGTLYPARREEWDNAKTQGAFFVEQHVVRTLIEAGKTSDNAPAYVAPVYGGDPLTSRGDEAPTRLHRPSTPSVPPPTPLPPLRPTPMPVAEYAPAMTEHVNPLAYSSDHTEHVRPLGAPRAMTNKAERKKHQSRMKLAAGGGAVIVVIAVIGAVAMGGGKAKTKLIVEEPPPAPVVVKQAPPPPATSPIVTPPTPTPTVETTSTMPSPSTLSTTTTTTPTTTTTTTPTTTATPAEAPRKVGKKPGKHAKPGKNTKPTVVDDDDDPPTKPTKETKWTSDSPFMPVRSKH